MPSIPNMPDVAGERLPLMLLFALALASFITILTEALPAGLLSQMSVSLGKASRFTPSARCGPQSPRGGSRNLHSGDKWIVDLTAAMLAVSRRQDEQATPA